MTIIFIPRRPSRTNHADEDNEKDNEKKDIKKDDNERSNRTHKKKTD